MEPRTSDIQSHRDRAQAVTAVRRAETAAAICVIGKQRASSDFYGPSRLGDRGPRWTLSAGLSRCGDFVGEDPGQDAFVVKYDARVLVAVVADGVSQSFFGDIAAHAISRYVALRLWEEAMRGRVPSGSELTQWLGDAFRARCDRAVGRRAIPGSVPAIVRDVLEESRTRNGSQTVFSAVIVDLLKRRACVFSLGNVQAEWIEDRDGCVWSLTGSDQSRWSSVHGLMGAPVTLTNIHNLRRVVLKSDGLARTSLVESPPPTAEAFNSICRDVHLSAHDDDIAFVDVALEGRY